MEYFQNNTDGGVTKITQLYPTFQICKSILKKYFVTKWKYDPHWKLYPLTFWSREICQIFSREICQVFSREICRVFPPSSPAHNWTFCLGQLETCHSSFFKLCIWRLPEYKCPATRLATIAFSISLKLHLTIARQSLWQENRVIISFQHLHIYNLFCNEQEAMPKKRHESKTIYV